MRIDFLTLFPEMCKTVMDESIIGRAQKKGAVEICYHQIRDYANNKHNRVDDPPFGGGMGMLLRAEPLALCMDDVIKQLGKKPYFIYMSALFTCIFLGFIVGTSVVADEVKLSSRFRSEKMFIVITKWIAPVCIVAILVTSILSAAGLFTI